MTKQISQRQALPVEDDQKIQQQQTLTLLQKNMLMRSAWTGPQPQLAS